MAESVILKPLSKKKKLQRPSFFQGKKMVRMRKVRVICTDPDATDYSSSEDESDKRARKRIVREICLPLLTPRGSSVLETESSCQDSSNGVRTSKNNDIVVSGNKTDNKGSKKGRDRPSSSGFKGVRQRKWGKWAAEIRNPFKSGARMWLGTFNTPVEASKAYEAKKLEFDSMLALAATERSNSTNTNTNTALAGSEDSESVLSHTSPSSVLDMETSASNVGQCLGPITDMGLEVEDQELPFDPLALPEIVGEELNFKDFDSLFADDFGIDLEDCCNMDLGIGCTKDEQPSELPDYDFDIANEDFACWMNGPLNIPCL